MVELTEKDVAERFLAMPKADRKPFMARVNNIISAQDPDADTPEAAVIQPLSGYLEMEIPKPPILVEPCQVMCGEITATIARAGKGKTTLACNRLIRWSAGLPLFEDCLTSQVPVRPLKMLLIENEGIAAMMQKHLRRLYEDALPDDNARALAAENLMIWGDGGYSNLKLDRQEDYDKVRRALNEHKPDVVIMEPLRGLHSADENDATAMQNVLDPILALAVEFECGILISHHGRKSGIGEDGEYMSAARGTTVLEGLAAVMEHFQGVKAGDFRELRWTKTRYAEAAAPMRMEFKGESWRYHYVSDDTLRREILQIMENSDSPWHYVHDLMEELNESEQIIRNRCNAMVKEGKLLYRTGERGKKYRLPDTETRGMDC